MRFKYLTSIFLFCLSLFIGQASWAFSLLGPEPAWQTPVLNYQQDGRDIGGWLDIGEEYRWNTPYLTYAFDSSFIFYFGTNGINAVEDAIAFFNALPPASQMNIDDYPLLSQRMNPQAAAYNLTDLKSYAMFFIIEHMGLGRPEVGVWRLRDREIPVPGLTNYLVIQRNFDPVYPYPRSSYINSVLYTYDTIIDVQPPGPGAFPRVVPVDTRALFPSTTVASGRRNAGGFYTSLTRDDVGGIRFLIRSNNFKVERLLPDVRVVHTNLLDPTQLWTLDLAELIKNSQNTTNTASFLLSGNIQPSYANLSITRTNARLGTIIETNKFAYYTNYPWAPERVVVETYTTNFVTLFDYEFGNVVVYNQLSERPVFVRVSEIVPAMNYTPGLSDVRTNTISEEFFTEFITNGEFYIVPTNLVRFHFTGGPIATNLTITTNLDFFAETLLTTRTNTELTLLLTTDLTTFSEQARTNDPAAMLSLYPDLLILSSNRYFTNLVSSNYIALLTNATWNPAGGFGVAYEWFFTTNIATNYNYVFGNVVTNFGDTNAVITNATILVEEEIIAPNPWDPAGSPFTTNLVSSFVMTNVPIGSMYIVPTNLFGYHIISTQLVDVVSLTNTLIFTNVFDGIEQTNTISYIRYETNYFLNTYPIDFVTTNDLATDVFGIRRESFTFATNHLFEIYPVELLNPTDSIGLRPGVEKINYVRVDYDAILGNAFNAITNEYVDTVITSTGIVQQVVRRTSPRPDIIFSVRDLGTASGTRTTTQSWDKNDNINGEEGQDGPGVITPTVTISFNNTWPVRFNYNAGAQYILHEIPAGDAWASFDGTTNAPILYPQGTSLSTLENHVLNPNP